MYLLLINYWLSIVLNYFVDPLHFNVICATIWKKSLFFFSRRTVHLSDKHTVIYGLTTQSGIETLSYPIVEPLLLLCIPDCLTWMLCTQTGKYKTHMVITYWTFLFSCFIWENESGGRIMRVRLTIAVPEAYLRIKL